MEVHMTDSTGFFVWYELMTTDVVAAKRFYENVVGWKTEDVPMPGMTYTLVKAGDAQVAGLMTLPKEASDAGLKPCWVGYIAVPDVDQFAKKVVSLGGKLHREPSDIPNVGRFAVVADPQGVIFNLFKGTGSPQLAAVSMEPGHVGWHELHSSDAAKAFEFYAALFGWTKDQAMDMGEMGTYQIFSIGGTRAGGMFNSPMPAKQWLYYFAVEDVDAALKRITDQGGKVMHGPSEVPGGAFIVQATDPQGAMFAVVGMRKQS
jgi:predicted enzyme related to lactoylglutathione lyase